MPITIIFDGGVNEFLRSIVKLESRKGINTYYY